MESLPHEWPAALSYCDIRIATKESIMKPSSQDEVAGKIHEVKGAEKENVGKLTNNPDLEAEGKIEMPRSQRNSWGR
jgi:hypothetical protein